MSGVELKPCAGSDASQTNILLPLGKSTVGRGPLLGIADKRVSRNHGLMEVEDGKIKIMPTHTNPTFYQAIGASKLSPIEKDIWQTLQHGDKVGLTPDQHIFEVIIHDRPINPSTQSLQSSMIESSPEKTPQKPVNSENTGIAKTDGDKKPEGQQNGDDKIADDEKSTEDEDQKEEKSEKKADEKTQETKDDNDEDTNGVGEEDSADGDDKEKVETVKLEDGKEVALPVQKERTLPNWMDKADATKDPAETEGSPPTTPKGRGRPKKADTEEGESPSKKGKGRPKGSASKGKGRGRGRPPKRSVDDDDDESASPTRKGESRGKRKKYSEEDYVEGDVEEEEEPKVIFKDDDDWMLTSEEEESDISDWENSQKSNKSHKGKKGTPGRKAKKGTPGTPGRKARKPSGKTPTRRAAVRGARQKSKAYYTDSEDDYDYDDEVYVPKPTKRTASRFPSSQSQGDEEDDYSPRKATPKKAAKPRAKKRATPAKKAGKKKKPCEYGAECYRKNPGHFKDFCHPGDADYKSPNSSGAEEKDDEEEKEECPYGAECYRNNKAHLKQYKHPPPPTANRPKREAAQKKAVVIQGDRSSLLHSGVSDDDGARNTYDDNDSFLDDALMGSEPEEGEEGEEKKEKGSKSDDSDWNPGDGEAKGAKKVKVH